MHISLFFLQTVYPYIQLFELQVCSLKSVSQCHSIAYSLSNISAKNYRNRLMWVESIVCNISVVFSETKCRYIQGGQKNGTPILFLR